MLIKRHDSKKTTKIQEAIAIIKKFRAKKEEELRQKIKSHIFKQNVADEMDVQLKAILPP